MKYKIENLYKIYNEFNKAINGIDLEIEEGKINVILGPSGSGKSTLLNIMSGLDSATSGKVFFEGNEITLLTEKELIEYRKNNIGFIFQSYNLVPTLTAKENIELGMNGKEGLKIKELVDLIELKDHINKYPYQMSGGQMQRIAIARALAKNPNVIFCDEPTGALDEEMGKKILTAIAEINEKYGTTIVIVTHNPSIADMADRVIKMSSGKIVENVLNKEKTKVQDLRWA